MTVRNSHRIELLLFIFTLTGLLRAFSAQKQKPQFKVQVNLVFLDVEALDRKGNPVTDLDRNDFVVRENGSPVEISNFAQLSNVSLSLAISLGTGFMSQSGLSITKNAVSQLIHLLKPEDEICLYSFDQRDAYLEQGFTRDRSPLIAALENIGVTSRNRRPVRIVRSFVTPPQTGLGIDLGLAAAKKGVNQRKAVLLIRDRMEGLAAASVEHVHESGCILIALGFPEGSRSRLTLIGDQSGSEQVILAPGESSASGEDGNVTELCRTIVHLLSSRYSIAYHTPLPESRANRKIEVLVPGHDYRVLARRSFVPLQ
jgi:hypothetical protein